jgi:single-strand DNA-binding protein
MTNATLVGNLGKDAESRTTPKGDTVVTLSLATTHGYGDRKATTWWKVTVFGKAAEWAGQWRKGDKVAASGEVYLDEWEGREGKRYTACMDARSVESQSPRRDDGGSQRPGRPVRDEPDDGDPSIPF